MAKLSVSDKAQRVLVFLIGLRHRHVRRALVALGFTQVDVDEGWQLFNQSSRVQLDVEPIARAVEEDVVAQVDAWENRWFPIADATLARHHPKVHDKVFLNLTQTEGPAVIVSVGTLVERIDALGKSGEYGPEGKAAKKLLEKRGLTPAVLDEARELIATVAQPSNDDDDSDDEADLEEQQEQIAEADDALWAWYLEWARIARTAIKDRFVLRRLGFLAPKPGKKATKPGEANGAAPADPSLDAPV